MESHKDLIETLIQNFFFKERLSTTEQMYLQEVIPIEAEKDISIETYIEMCNEVASFYSGEFAKNIKKYLLLNDLLAKDKARLLKEELMLFRRFFHFLSHEIEKFEIQESNKKRIIYVIIKIDSYLKKYVHYLVI
ncbi:MAG TPA: hypothetical protein DHW82_05210 [Spirochaetia bacterium]|nr:MAG: hypothetical protein A2Y41_05270 [Spirochaetes bacterium GWB1_36_13]HCL56390.1 hypothetical protein [Spirochaetia bacterium]